MFSQIIASIFSMLLILATLAIADHHGKKIDTEGAVQMNRGQQTLDSNPAGENRSATNQNKTIPVNDKVEKEEDVEKLKKRKEKTSGLKLEDESSKKKHPHL